MEQAAVLDVPLSAEEHHQERTARFGMIIFLLSEAMLFAGLICGYIVLRLGAESWPPVGFQKFPLPLTLINTAILVTSSGTYHWAEGLIKKGKSGTFALFITLALGSVFLTLQGKEWFALKGEEHLWFNTGGIYGSCFFILTGFHGLHVFIGAILVALAWVRSLFGHFTPERHTYLTLAGYYWHFVDVVWIGLVGVLYLWR